MNAWTYLIDNSFGCPQLDSGFVQLYWSTCGVDHQELSTLAKIAQHRALHSNESLDALFNQVFDRALLESECRCSDCLLLATCVEEDRRIAALDLYYSDDDSEF